MIGWLKLRTSFMGMVAWMVHVQLMLQRKDSLQMWHESPNRGSFVEMMTIEGRTRFTGLSITHKPRQTLRRGSKPAAASEAIDSVGCLRRYVPYYGKPKVTIHWLLCRAGVESVAADDERKQHPCLPGECARHDVIKEVERWTNEEFALFWTPSGSDTATTSLTLIC